MPVATGLGTLKAVVHPSQEKSVSSSISSLKIAAAISFVLYAGGALAGNLIANGDFANIGNVFVDDTGLGGDDLMQGGTNIPQWTNVTPPGAPTGYVNELWVQPSNNYNLTASPGNGSGYLVDLTGEGNDKPYGGLAQKIQTTRGAQYRVTFSLGASTIYNTSGTGSAALTVTATGSATLVSTRFSLTPTSTNQWATETLVFTADSASTTIAFIADSSNTSRYVGLDDVSVVALLGSAAPGAQADYLGEGKAGYTVWRPSTGYWYSIDGAGGSATDQWGAPTDLPVLGDFDGDGKSDFAVFRPSTGFWYIKRSSDQQIESHQWGAASDLPVVGDFDGDGKTDLAVYRPATGYWYIIRSSDNVTVAKQFGEAADIPVLGDFDGDGKSDVAVYRPSNGYWYITQSSNNAVVAQQWGAASDIPVSADYDGDGKTDIAVYRPSTGYWYIIQSSDGQVVAKQWGQSGDVPVARDYDGDGRTDIAVWRPSTGYWYVIQSSSGQVVAQQWGAATDIAVNGTER
jgi:hypothetical protein